MRRHSTIRNLVFAILLLAVPLNTYAQDPQVPTSTTQDTATQDRVLAEMPGALLLTHWNEVSLLEKKAAHDPTKFRVGGWLPESGVGYLGALSFNSLFGGDGPGNTTQHEKIMVAFKVDPYPVTEFYFQRRADTTEDRDMVRALRLSATEAEFSVPIKAPNLVNGAIVVTADQHPGAMWSPDGHFVTQQQPDGNFVSYELAYPFDVGVYRALWSSFGGKIDNPRWSDQPEGEAGRTWKHLWIW
jgi:hypothetical protein